MLKIASLALSLCLALSLAAGEVDAASNSLIGAWSYSSGRGRPPGPNQGVSVIFFRFDPDGTFRQQVTIPGGVRDFVGRYQLSPDNATLQLLYQDYEPKQDCRYGACYPVPPMFAPGQTINGAISFIGDTRFELMDASGPLLFVRNQ